MELRLREVEGVIAKIVRDLGIGDREIPYQDFIEWFYEGLQQIGAYSQFQERLMVPIEIVDYRGKLPRDFYTMIANPHISAYKVNHDTITTNIKNGTLKINYLSMPVDDRGYPLIPDNVAFDNALMWKVAFNMSIRGDLPNKNLTLEFCQAQWFKYCRQARAQANAFSPDNLERHRDMRHKIVPDIHQYDVDFHRLDGRFKEDTPDGRE
jgi:hypothetical protein